MRLRQWGSDLADLVLGRACLVCQAPGASLCTPCLAALRDRGGPQRGELGVVGPTGDVPLWFSLPYQGVGARLVLAYKEHGHLSLRGPLGLLLADAVVGAVGSRATAVTLVPVPSSSRSARGFDALGGLVGVAVHELRSRGLTARTAPLVQQAHGHRPLKTLDRRARWSAIHGTMRIDHRAVRSMPPGVRIVVDDVVTSGATTMEVMRVLRDAGVSVAAIASVAHQVGRSGHQPG